MLQICWEDWRGMGEQPLQGAVLRGENESSQEALHGAPERVHRRDSSFK